MEEPEDRLTVARGEGWPSSSLHILPFSLTTLTKDVMVCIDCLNCAL